MGAIAMVRDVTERHALEDELRRAQKLPRPLLGEQIRVVTSLAA